MSLRVLGFAVAEGPILLLDLDQVDEDILAAYIEALVQPISDRLVEGALLVERSSLVERQLDEDAVLGPSNAEVIRVGDEPVFRMLGDDLEAVVLRRIQGRDHGIVDHLADGAAIIGRLAPNEIDASERHVTTPFPVNPTAGVIILLSRFCEAGLAHAPGLVRLQVQLGG